MKKTILTGLVCLWGMLSFIVIASECENFEAFVWSKIVGFVSLGLCMLVGRWMVKKGWIELDNEA